VTRTARSSTPNGSGGASPWSTPAGGCGPNEPLARQVSLQAERAIDEADLVVLVVDGAVGPTDEDRGGGRRPAPLHQARPLAVNKVDDANRESDAWDFTRLASATRSPSRRCTAGEAASSSTSSWSSCRRKPRRSLAGRRGPGGGRRARDGGRSRSRWPSWGGPTWGSRRCSTGWWARRRAVVHDALAHPGHDRHPARDGGRVAPLVDTAGMRRKSRIDETNRVLQPGASAAGHRPGRRRPAGHRRHRRSDPSGPAPGRADRRLGLAPSGGAQQVDLLDPDDREGLLADVADRLAFLAYAPVLKIRR